MINVISSNHQVIMMSEQTMKNRIVVEKDPKGCAKCFVHSSTVETKTNTNLEQKKGLIYVKQNRLKESVPVGVVFKVNFIRRVRISPMDALLDKKIDKVYLCYQLWFLFILKQREPCISLSYFKSYSIL